MLYIIFAAVAIIAVLAVRDIFPAETPETLEPFAGLIDVEPPTTFDGWTEVDGHPVRCTID